MTAVRDGEFVGGRWDRPGRWRFAWRQGIVTAADCLAMGDSPAEFLTPGLVDLQVNGLAGIHFGAPETTVADIAAVVGRLRAEGVTALLPTLITDSAERFEAALRTLAAARRDPDLAESLPGFHLEGPHISPEDGPRGAHPREHCRPPDLAEFARFQTAAEGGVRLVTLAPEWPGSMEFIRALTAEGIRVAIGHSAADFATIRAAADAGATLSTHLGNGCAEFLHRHGNPLVAQLDDDRLTATVIVDGHHLPEALVRLFHRVKGPERLLLVSDAVQHAGMPPGEYPGYDGGWIVVRGDGFVGVQGTNRLAGSGMLLRQGVANYMAATGCGRAEAVAAASMMPTRFLGLPVANWEVDAPADGAIWRELAQPPLATVVGGRWVFGG